MKELNKIRLVISSTVPSLACPQALKECFMSSSGSSDQDSTTISQISFREGARMLPCFVNVLGADSSGLYWNEGCSLDLGSKNSGYIGMRVLLETGFN